MHTIWHSLSGLLHEKTLYGVLGPTTLGILFSIHCIFSNIVIFNYVVSQGGLGQSSGLGTGMNIRPAGWLGQASVGVGQTGMGVGQTGMGVGQTGMGAGSNTPGLGGPRFGSSAMFSSTISHDKQPYMSTAYHRSTSVWHETTDGEQHDGSNI